MGLAIPEREGGGVGGGQSEEVRGSSSQPSSDQPLGSQFAIIPNTRCASIISILHSRKVTICTQMPHGEPFFGLSGHTLPRPGSQWEPVARSPIVSFPGRRKGEKENLLTMSTRRKRHNRVQPPDSWVACFDYTSCPVCATGNITVITQQSLNKQRTHYSKERKKESFTGRECTKLCSS